MEIWVTLLIGVKEKFFNHIELGLHIPIAAAIAHGIHFWFWTRAIATGLGFYQWIANQYGK